MTEIETIIREKIRLEQQIAVLYTLVGCLGDGEDVTAAAFDAMARRKITIEQTAEGDWTINVGGEA